MVKNIKNFVDKLQPKDIVEQTINGHLIKFGILHPRLRYYAMLFPEKEVLQFIDSLTTNDILVDLGAAEGRFALYAAKKGLKVWALEPDYHNFSALITNRDLNKLNNLNCLQSAIGKNDEIGELRSGQPFPGGHQKVVMSATSRQDLQFQFLERQQIKILTYNSFCNQNNLLPTALKIDIDGSELDFFLGKPNLASVKHLMIELCETDINYSKIVEYLIGDGFQLKSKHRIPDERHLYNCWYIRLNNIKIEN